jgi:hypothetical protein
MSAKTDRADCPVGFCVIVGNEIRLPAEAVTGWWGWKAGELGEGVESDA